MHLEAKHFVNWVKNEFPRYFEDGIYLDAGGGDINGNNRYLFENPLYYHCNDVGTAPNATLVCPTKDLPFENEYFDTIISTECFEHDPQYIDSINKIIDILKPGGLFIFTCASTGRPEHGTRKTRFRNTSNILEVAQSWGTRCDLTEFRDYYKNLTIQDIKNALMIKDHDIDCIFDNWASYYGGTNDLYFIGFKNGGTSTNCIPPYYPNPELCLDTGFCKLTGAAGAFCMQHDTFDLTHAMDVHYGYNDKWISKHLEKGRYIANDDLFGDPYKKTWKMCKI